MLYLGLDYHKRYSFATIIDGEGNKIISRKVLNLKDEFCNFLREYRPLSAVIEACRNWQVPAELLDGLVTDLKMAHPVKVKAIAHARIKNDSIDSTVLAELLRSNLIPESYMRNHDEVQKQRIVRSRIFYVRLRTQIMNRIHYIIDLQREEVREEARVFSDLLGKKGLQWLRSINLTEPDQRILNGLLQIYNELSEKVKDAESHINSIMDKDYDYQLLKTIPGIGDVMAALIKVEVGSISRFDSSSKLCSYAGLVPSTYSSGGKTRHGKITKQGNKWLRWAMIEAVIPATRSNTEIHQFYNRIKRRKGSKAAKVATARRLLTIVYRVVKYKDFFKEFKKDVYYNNASKSESPSKFFRVS